MPGWVRYANPGKSVRIYLRLLTGIKGWNLIVFFRPILHQVPAQAMIECETRFDAPAILPVRADIFVTSIVILAESGWLKFVVPR